MCSIRHKWMPQFHLSTCFSACPGVCNIKVATSLPLLFIYCLLCTCYGLLKLNFLCCRHWNVFSHCLSLYYCCSLVLSSCKIQHFGLLSSLWTFFFLLFLFSEMASFWAVCWHWKDTLVVHFPFLRGWLVARHNMSIFMFSKGAPAHR